MIVFDLETTGLPKAEGSDLDMQPKIIEFGAIKLVAHNLPFDRKVLKFDLERIDRLLQFPWPYEHICTVEVGESVWGKKRKLGDIHKEVTGEEIKDAHRSVNDVEATIRILKWYRSEGHV